jgi:hypothetical protein
MDFIPEILSATGGFSAGLLLRYFWPRLIEVTKEVIVERVVEKIIEAAPAIIESPAEPVSKNRVACRFKHRNGRRDNKSLFEHSLTDELVWSGKKFKLDTISPDGIRVYKEIE